MLRILTTLLVLTSTATGYAQTIQIGYSPATGACVVSDYANRSTFPWQQQKEVFARSDGIQAMGALVRTNKGDTQQSDGERKALERCVRLGTRKVLTEGFNSTSSAVEDKIAHEANVCLRETANDLSIRFITLSKGPIECVPTVRSARGGTLAGNTTVSVMVVSFRETSDAEIAKVIISSLVSRGYSVFAGRWDDAKPPNQEIEIHFKPAARAAAAEVQAIVEEAYQLARKRAPTRLVPVPPEERDDKNDIRVRIF